MSNKFSDSNANPKLAQLRRPDKTGVFDARVIQRTDIEIIGSGTAGDKLGQLIDKTEQLRKIGFHTPRRVGFAEDFFSASLKKARIGDSLRDISVEATTESRVRNAGLTQEQFAVLEQVWKSFGGAELIVRSSGEGDSRGTGTYESIRPYGADVQELRKAFQKVLASYFSESAIRFRKDAGLQEGFGIIIEPVVGQIITYYQGEVNEYQNFEPVLSGFGYTSTTREGAYISVVPGFGGAVDSKDGLKVSKKDLEANAWSLDEFIYVERNRYGEEGAFSTMPKILRPEENGYGLLGWKVGEIVSSSGALKTFLDMIEKTEKVFGKPQYLEWALTLEGNTPKFWINQIADISKKLDIIDFSDIGKKMFVGRNVTGSGTKEANGAVICTSPGDIKLVREFNQLNTDYVLVFSSAANTAMAKQSRLRYEDYSNASVLIEMPDTIHVIDDPVSHLGGQAAVAGKFVAVLDDKNSDWEVFNSKETTESGLIVYMGKLRIIASEKEDKLIVGAIE